MKKRSKKGRKESTKRSKRKGGVASFRRQVREKWHLLAIVAVAAMCLLKHVWSEPESPHTELEASTAQGQLRGASSALPRPGFGFYFAYASDLSPDRVKKGSSTSAIPLGAGSVQDLRFDYTIFSKVWKGGVADLVPSKGDTAWGMVYEFPLRDVPQLDKQKGVGNADPKYEKVDVRVRRDGEEVDAFTYTVRAAKRAHERVLPSIQYRKCILKGSTQAVLPNAYQAELRAIPDNGEHFKRKSVGSACD